MDTTRVLLKGKDRNYQLIVVTGNAELISNMLTGASSAEAALLVVSIEEGIKEQTRQHLGIAKLLGIEQLGIVVNKIDKIAFQQQDFEEIKQKLKEILNHISYNAEKIKFFPVSAYKGDNVTKVSEKTPWYKGSSLLEFIEGEIKTPESLEKLPLSFLVQDRYSDENEKILVGRVETGKLKLGQEIIFLPANEKTRVKEIRDSETILEEAETGHNVGITLVDSLNISRGAVGVSTNSNLKVADRLSGEIFWIEIPSQKNLVLECGTAQMEGELQELEIVNQGEKTSYNILLREKIVFEPKGKTILGKIVLKDKGKIIGVGNIHQNFQFPILNFQ